MSLHQRYVDVLPTNLDGRHSRRSRVWLKACAALAKHAKRDKPARYIELPLPSYVLDAWTVRRDGMPFRCLVQYRMTPLPSGYVGRVDLAWESKAL